MRKLVFALLVSMLLVAPKALACPPAGCVEIAAQNVPEGEYWGYDNNIPEEVGGIHGASVVSVEEIDEGLLVNMVFVADDGADIGDVVDVEYYVQVDEYALSGGQLIESHDPQQVFSYLSGGCSVTGGWGTCYGGEWTCWMGVCGYKQTCPFNDPFFGWVDICQNTTGRCRYDNQACQCEVTYPSCFPYERNIAVYVDHCPPNRECVVNIQAASTS